MRPDVHSYYDRSQQTITHITWEKVHVDFTTQTLDCIVEHRLDRVGETWNPLDLDTRDLEISRVTDAGGSSLYYQLYAADSVLGSRLHIMVPPGVSIIRIHYKTSPTASGLQWLTAVQAGSRYSFVYSQAEPLHGRSYMPLQDTPLVRVTFEANLIVPEALRGVMGGDFVKRTVTDGLATEIWRMDQPIPSYLIAFAVGELMSQDLSDRSRVWAQPNVLSRAAREFTGIEAIMQAAESLFGPYPWGRFDLLFLPACFPYGGMENPKLTFLNPALIVGDQSLVWVVAHELAHAWSGNLVTCATWGDFWVNEGMTTYVQYRIAALVWGHDTAMLQKASFLHELKSHIAQFITDGKPQFACLEPPIGAETDPDETFSRVPYLMGALFLQLLEETVGRVEFDRWLCAYMEKFAFRSITTKQLLSFFASWFPDVLMQVNAEAWLHGVGLPDNTPTIETYEIGLIRGLARERELPAAQMTKNWTGTAWCLYLAEVPKDLGSADFCRRLDARYDFQRDRNPEVRVAWLGLAFAAGVAPDLPELKRFLASTGRGAYIRPVYRALMENPTTADWARTTFEEVRGGYHPIMQKVIGGMAASSAPKADPNPAPATA